MRTVIDGDRTREEAVRELSDADHHRITAGLAEAGIRVEAVVDIFHVLNLWALAPISTAQEVRAIAAFAAVTDVRIAWHAFRGGEGGS